MTPDFPHFLRFSEPLPNLRGGHIRHPYLDYPLLLNDGYGDEQLTVELALLWAERLADEVLR